MTNVPIHTLEEVNEKPYFRRLRVPGGWLYNMWVSGDCQMNYDRTGQTQFTEGYSKEWVFVPERERLSPTPNNPGDDLYRVLNELAEHEAKAFPQDIGEFITETGDKVE